MANARIIKTASVKAALPVIVILTWLSYKAAADIHGASCLGPTAGFLAGALRHGTSRAAAWDGWIHIRPIVLADLVDLVRPGGRIVEPLAGKSSAHDAVELHDGFGGLHE